MIPRVLQEEHREAKLTLRPPSLAAPYAPVQSWQHQPEKLIFESCGYEANVSSLCPPSLTSLLLSMLAGPRAPVVFSTPQLLPAPGGRGTHRPGWGKRVTGRGSPLTVVPDWLVAPCGNAGLLSRATARSHSIWAPC